MGDKPFTIGNLMDYIQQGIATGTLNEHSPVILMDMAGDEADCIFISHDNGILTLQADEA